MRRILGFNQYKNDESGQILHTEPLSTGPLFLLVVVRKGHMQATDTDV